MIRERFALSIAHDGANQVEDIYVGRWQADGYDEVAERDGLVEFEDDDVTVS